MSNDPRILRLIGAVNAQVHENTYETRYMKAQHEARVNIGQRQIELSDLVGKTIDSAVTNLDIHDFLIKTDEGQFVYMLANESWGSVALEPGTLDIEDAATHNLIDPEVYADYTEAREAYFNHKEERSTESRFRSAIGDIGIERARKILAEMKTCEEIDNMIQDQIGDLRK